MPKVSVVIPTFNRAGFLQTAISSVLKQTYQDFEIIVVDDASADNTREVVSAFEDDRISYICHENNKGEAASRNTGILNARGEYIAFLDDDDEWLPEKVGLQIALLRNAVAEIGAVYTGLFAIHENGNTTISIRSFENREEMHAELLLQNFVGTPSTVLMRRGCIEKVGLFDEGIAYRTDQDYWIRIVKKGFQFEIIKEPLVKYHLHKNRLSNDLEIMERGLDAFLLKYRKETNKLHSKRNLARYRKIYGLSYLSFAVRHCFEGSTTKAIKAYLKSIRLYPFEIRSYFNLGISLLGARNYTRIKKFKDKVMGLKNRPPKTILSGIEKKSQSLKEGRS